MTVNKLTTNEPLICPANEQKLHLKMEKPAHCSVSNFTMHPTKVIDNCPHGTQKLEDALELKGEPIGESGINVKKVSCRLRIQITLSLFFFVVEFVTGIISGSIALIADSYHMAADVMALIVAFICLRMADKESKSNSYGWVRAEALGGFFNGLFLLTVCLSIFQEASGRILTPRNIGKPQHVLIVGFIGLVINVIGLCLLNGQGHGHSHGGGGGHGHSHGGGGHGHSHSSKNHGHSHADGHSNSNNSQNRNIGNAECAASLLDNEESGVELHHISDGRTSRANTAFSTERRFTGPGMPYATHMASEILEDELNENAEDGLEQTKKRKKSKNVNIHGVYLHLMSDAFGSVIVILASACVLLWPEWRWSKYLDPALSLILACMMSFSAIGLVKDSVNILLMKAPSGIEKDEVKKDLTNIVGVAEVTDLDIWSLTGSRLIATARVNFCHPAIFADAVFKIRKYFHDNGIHSTTIEPTFETKCMESMRVVQECLDAEHKNDNSEKVETVTEIEE